MREIVTVTKKNNYKRQDKTDFLLDFDFDCMLSIFTFIFSD